MALFMSDIGQEHHEQDGPTPEQVAERRRVRRKVMKIVGIGVGIAALGLLVPPLLTGLLPNALAPAAASGVSGLLTTGTGAAAITSEAVFGAAGSATAISGALAANVGLSPMLAAIAGSSGFLATAGGYAVGLGLTGAALGGSYAALRR